MRTWVVLRDRMDRIAKRYRVSRVAVQALALDFLEQQFEVAPELTFKRLLARNIKRGRKKHVNPFKFRFRKSRDWGGGRSRSDLKPENKKENQNEQQ